MVREEEKERFEEAETKTSRKHRLNFAESDQSSSELSQQLCWDYDLCSVKDTKKKSHLQSEERTMLEGGQALCL